MLWRSLLLFLIAFSLAHRSGADGASNAEVEPTAPRRDGPHNAFRFSASPEDIGLARNGKVFQFSSTDPLGGNNDYNHFLGEVDGRKILAEMTGPGAIVRMWFTGSSTMQFNVLRIEVDEEVALEISIHDLTRGDMFPFVSPLVGEGSTSGFFCYVPVPFRQSCRVTLKLNDSLSRYHYYQVQCIQFPDARGVNPFRLPLDPEEARSIEAAAFNWNGPPSRDGMTRSDLVPVIGGMELLRCPGSGLIRQWEIETDPSRREAVDEVWLHIVESDRVVFKCPLPALFGLAPGESEVSNRLLKAESGLLRFLWPMAHYGPIRLVLTGRVDSIRSAAFQHEPLSEREAKHWGRLRLEHRQQQLWDEEEVCFFDVRGRGHFAGLWLRVHGESEVPRLRLSYLEGDDSTSVDGDVSLAFQGTGMEDYFNGAFYFNQGVAEFPNHGVSYCNAGAETDTESGFAMYRHMMADAIPFRESMKLSWQLIPEWRTPSPEFETVAFWYDCSECWEDRVWPDCYGWDLDRDRSVDIRDLILYRAALREDSESAREDLPWPFRLIPHWTGFQPTAWPN